MNRYGGMSSHRYGDLFMNLPAWRTIKRLDPDAHVTFFINGNYRSAAPLFLDQPDIDRVHITHSPVGDLDEVDREWVRRQGFKTFFSLMGDHDHLRPWFLTRNQPQEVLRIHGIPLPADETGKLSLNRWFEPTSGLSKWVALQAFAGSYDPSNTKMLSIERAQRIVDLIRARGYSVLQLGIPSEPKLEGTTRIDNDFFGAVKDLLGCRALVTTDSGFNWAASCYDHPTLGLYSHEYYDMGPHGGENRVSAIQPLNTNAIHLSARRINEIALDDISIALDKLLS